MLSAEERYKKELEFVRVVKELMEERGFTMGEAEACASILVHEVERNNKRLCKEQPFVVSED